MLRDGTLGQQQSADDYPTLMEQLIGKHEPPRPYTIHFSSHTGTSRTSITKWTIKKLQKLTLKLQIVLNTTSDGTEKTKETKAEGAQQQMTIQRTLNVQIQQNVNMLDRPLQAITS